MLSKETSPISNIVWKKASELLANDYNPNSVQPDEMKLLEYSINSVGWIQPILITTENVIIDGFHRATLARLKDWEVPCAVLSVSEAERMLITIRINRAKGTHIAFKMSEIIKKLIDEFYLPKDYVASAIGASLSEIELLLMEDVFEKLDITNHKYSTAWEVKK